MCRIESDGNGLEDDFLNWKLYNPTSAQCHQILDNNPTAASEVIPKWVKLSDSGMGLIVLID